MAVPFPKRIRLPLEAYENPERIFHLTVAAAIDETPFVNRTLGDNVWRELAGQRLTGRLVIHAACLMPDHLHMVASAGSESLVTWLQAFKTYTTRFWWQTGRRGSLWQASFHDVEVHGKRHYSSLIAYVVRNPVAAGLVDEPEQWPWVGVWVGEELSPEGEP